MTASETIFTNCNVVLPDRTLHGTVVIRDGVIADVSANPSSVQAAIDLEGDYLIPGLVELHTDNLEHNIKPRPSVLWPIEEAIIAHDAQMASSGVTTVLDALSVGDTQRKGFRSQLLPKAVEIISEVAQNDRLRAEHCLHLRCEVTDGDMIELLEPHADNPHVRLVSITDHTPGQRQWVDIQKYRHRNKMRLGLSDAEVDVLVAQKRDDQARYAAPNRKAVLELLGRRPLPLATHDDTTIADVDDAAFIGATISEFPTTENAAAAARKRGLSIVMGAPNIVLGGSHSGNVSASELAAKGHLDILSSDYVPASLIQACWMLHRAQSIPLHAVVAFVTANPAGSVGLTDRGSIVVGLRADLVRVHAAPDRPPAVRASWRTGRRIA